MGIETTGQRRARLGLAGGLAAMGALHFVTPAAFESMIPGWIPGSPKMWNQLSGAAEVSSGLLLFNTGTRRLGGYAAFATLAGVYVANIQAAVDGGIPGLDGFGGSRQAALIRLPFQFPMLWLAWQQTKPLVPGAPGHDGTDTTVGAARSS